MSLYRGRVVFWRVSFEPHLFFEFERRSRSPFGLRRAARSLSAFASVSLRARWVRSRPPSLHSGVVGASARGLFGDHLPRPARPDSQPRLVLVLVGGNEWCAEWRPSPSVRRTSLTPQTHSLLCCAVAVGSDTRELLCGAGGPASGVVATPIKVPSASRAAAYSTAGKPLLDDRQQRPSMRRRRRCTSTAPASSPAAASCKANKTEELRSGAEAPSRLTDRQRNSFRIVDLCPPARPLPGRYSVLLIHTLQQQVLSISDVISSSTLEGTTVCQSFFVRPPVPCEPNSHQASTPVGRWYAPTRTVVAANRNRVKDKLTDSELIVCASRFPLSQLAHGERPTVAHGAHSTRKSY